MNEAVTQMVGVTQSNATQTEELSATAEQLSAPASELSHLVAKFRVGAASAGPARSRAPKNALNAPEEFVEF